MGISINIQTFARQALITMLILTAVPLLATHKVVINQELACDSTAVLLPLEVSGFENVGSFTFFIQIDTTAVEFVALENAHAQLSGGAVIVNFIESSSCIAINWFSVGGITIPEGKLFDLELEYHHGLTDLEFLIADCEIATPDGELIEDVVFENGMLMPAMEIAAQPQPLTVTEEEQAQFEIQMQHSGAHFYQWQVKEDEQWVDLIEPSEYSGVNTAQLIIDEVPLSFNGNMYRCAVGFNECAINSEEVILTVSPLTVVNKAGYPPAIEVHPNPFFDELHYKISNDALYGNQMIELINISGITKATKTITASSGILHVGDLPSGTYFLLLTGRDNAKNVLKVVKH